MRFLTSLLMLVSIAFASPANAEIRIKIPGMTDIKISSNSVSEAIEKLKDIGHDLGENIHDLGIAIGEAAKATGEAAKAAAEAVVKAAQATAEAIAKTLEVASRAASAAITATANLAREALESVGEIVKSAVNGAYQTISTVVNSIEAGVHLIAGEKQSTKFALKRAEHSFKDSVNNYDNILDESLNMAFRAGKNSILIPTNTYDAATKNRGRLTREVGKAHYQIGLVLTKAAEPQNLAKIAVLYGASMVAGPIGAAVANVLYDELILKKHMSPKQMAKSFVIGAVAGYAAQGIQGIDIIKEAPYLQKAAAQIARNLSRDAGEIALGGNGYTSKDLFKSLASGLATLEIGNGLAETIAEYTIDNVEDSVTDQLIESEFHKLDLNKIRDAALSGLSNGITNVGVETLIKETVEALKPKEVKPANLNTIYALNKTLFKSLSELKEYELALQQKIILLRLAHLSTNERNNIINELIELNNEIKQETAQKVYNKDYSELTSNEITTSAFTATYKLSLSALEVDLTSADNSTDDGRYNAGAALIIREISVITGTPTLTLIEGGLESGAISAGLSAARVVPAFAIMMALFESESIGYGSDKIEIPTSNITIFPPNPDDNEGWVLYEAAKKGDNVAKLRYLNRDCEALKTSITASSPTINPYELREIFEKDALFIAAMNGDESAKNDYISKYGDADYEGKFLTQVSTGRTVPNNLNEQLAFQDAMSNPQNGEHLKNIIMKDPRFPAEEGWVKMEQVIDIEGGAKQIRIHYIMNTKTGVATDFKIKDKN